MREGQHPPHGLCCAAYPLRGGIAPLDVEMPLVGDEETVATLTINMTLRDLLVRYMAANECSPRYAESLLRTVRRAEDSGIVEVCQLVPERVNKFLAGLDVGQTTRHNIRRELLTLWRFAHDREWTDVYPARVRKIRAAFAAPETWELSGLSKILEAAEQDETPISSRVTLRRCDVIPAWAGLAYETGMRFADIHALTKKHFRNECVAVTAQKTGKPLVRVLSEQTQHDVARLFLHSPDGTLFKWLLPRRRAFLMWRAFLDKHGFGGSTKWFRRAAATAIERVQPGAATSFLQHSSPMLVRRHYLDGTQAAPPMSPPPIRKPR